MVTLFLNIFSIFECKILNIRKMTDEEFLKKVGERIRERRKLLGLSQDKLAESVGLNRTAITRIEGGGINFTIKLIRKIAKEIGVEVSELLIE